MIAKFIFPLFGIVVTLGAIGHGICAKGKAEAYTRAFEACKRRRAAVERSVTRLPFPLCGVSGTTLMHTRPLPRT
ncbi:unnamed protein product [Gemmata massiliana]|uniref:Uncharacterized protein n=1 Tax=Gemmata massiliana TaxID=1210884 RepID=A0A6P2DI18_9BACT|nr:unnamed protein product [Gemmata massiliana]